MEQDTILLTLALVFGLYAAWNIGANDVANAMGTSVGSKALTIVQAVVLAAIFEFLGAVLYGSYVTETLQKGIIELPDTGSSRIVVLGMISALFATGLWLHIASTLGLPVSTTHSIVGAIVGFGICAGGIDAICWKEVTAIGLSWIVSPLLGAVVAFLVFSSLRSAIFFKPVPLAAAKKLMPKLTCFVIFILTFSLCSSVGRTSFLTAVISSIIMATITYLSVLLIEYIYLPKESAHDKSHADDMQRLIVLQKMRRKFGETPEIAEEIEAISARLHPDLHLHLEAVQFRQIEKMFAVLQIITACMMAFAHGANDVANAIGPLQAVINALKIPSDLSFLSYGRSMLIFGGFGIVLGLATYGWKVIETIGKKITELTPSRGFAAEFAASLTILLASRLGFPISTTHTLVGAVLGVGLAGGLATLNLRTIRDIAFSWLITIPAGAFFSVVTYQLLSHLI